MKIEHSERRVTVEMESEALAQKLLDIDILPDGIEQMNVGPEPWLVILYCDADMDNVKLLHVLSGALLNA